MIPRSIIRPINLRPVDGYDPQPFMAQPIAKPEQIALALRAIDRHVPDADDAREIAAMLGVAR